MRIGQVRLRGVAAMAVLANDTAVKPRRRLRRARGAERSAATRVSPCAVRKPGQAGWRDRQCQGLAARKRDTDTAIRVEGTSMRTARAAAVMTPADQAIQEPEAPFSIRRRQRGGRRVVAVSSSVSAMEALRARIRAQSKTVADHIAADPEAQGFIDNWTTPEPISR